MAATVALVPPPILQFFDNQGRPCAGGTVLTQVGGINYPTYQDAAGNTPLPNPIPLNSRGEISNAAGVSCQLFLVSGQTYTFTLFDAQGNQLNQSQYVTSAVNISAATLAASTGSSNVGWIQSGANAVARNLLNKLRELVSSEDFTGRGTYNIGVGSGALAANTTGNNNAAFGVSALTSNTTGTLNTAVGSAMASNITGNSNVAIGNSALGNSQHGDRNVAIGVNALVSANLLNASDNTGVGTSALSSVTSGYNNVAVGSGAGASITTPNGVTAVGCGALQFPTTGTYNTAIGNVAMQAASTASFGTAVGAAALTVNTGGENTAVGYQSLTDNTGGYQNTAVGTRAGSGTTTGAGNVYFGYQSGLTATPANKNVSGSNCTYVGYQTGPSTTTQISNATAVGSGATCSASNQITLGAGVDTVRTPGYIYPGTDAAQLQSACGITAGTGAPSNGNGTNGCIYFRSDGGTGTTVYQKRGGVWVAIL